jgi:hypothetical protein
MSNGASKGCMKNRELHVCKKCKIDGFVKNQGRGRFLTFYEFIKIEETKIALKLHQ